MKKLIKILLLFGVVIFFAFSCEEQEQNESTVCGVHEPLKNVSWLKTLVSGLNNDIEIDSATITVYDYLGSNALYLYIERKDQNDIPNPIYDCNGSIIFKVGGNQLNDSSTIFFNMAINPKLIWTK